MAARLAVGEVNEPDRKSRRQGRRPSRRCRSFKHSQAPQRRPGAPGRQPEGAMLATTAKNYRQTMKRGPSVRRVAPVPFLPGQDREGRKRHGSQGVRPDHHLQIVEVSSPLRSRRPPWRGGQSCLRPERKGGGWWASTAAGARVSNITFDVAVTAVEGPGAEAGLRARPASPRRASERIRTATRCARHAAFPGCPLLEDRPARRARSSTRDSFSWSKTATAPAAAG
jgi:hypothetical protein